MVNARALEPAVGQIVATAPAEQRAPDRSSERPGATSIFDRSLRPLPSLPRLLEIAQVRRRLILLGGHQHAVAAEEIVFRADDDLVVALVAGRQGELRLRFGIVPERLV